MSGQRVAAPPSPYKGLAPFEDSPVDSLFFFGRERESEIVAANLLAYRLTVLYGASGVGKSSLLRAGVAHRLREAGNEVIAFSTWSGDAVSTLMPVLRDVSQGRELCVILDQFDEYFLYHESDGEFARELADVVTRPGLRVNVLISIRDDMLSQLDRFKALIPDLFSNYLRLDYLDRRAAREAIVGPLERYNTLVRAEERVTADPQLVEAVLDGSGSEGQIEAPYLQLVMQRLWEEEQTVGSRTLRLETLARLGGAEEIVRAHLVEAMESLSEHDRDLAAELFNHLVTPSGTKIAHELADLAQYASVGEREVAPVLAALAEERIVRPVTAPGAHDGARYEIYHDVLAEPVVAWRARHEAERELERTRADARRRHRRLLVVTIVSLLAVVSMILVTLFALAQRRDARRQAAEARAAARSALVGELTARATSALSTEPQRSLSLAVRAARLEPTPEIESVLRSAIIRSPLAIIHVGDGPVNNVDFSRNGLGIAGDDDGTALLFRAATGKLVGAPLKHGAPVRVALLSPDGRLAVTEGGKEGRILLWDPRSSRRLRTLRHGATVLDAALTSDGTRLATAGVDGLVVVWDTRSGARLQDIAVVSAARSLQFSKDGSLLLVVAADGHAYLYDAGTGRLLHVLGPARLYNERTRTFQVIDPHIAAADFSPGADLATIVGRDGTVLVWELPAGKLHKVFTATGHPLDVAFSPRGSLFVTVSTDGTGIVWNAGGGRISVLAGHTNLVTHGSFSPDGTLVATASTDGSARVWKAKTGKMLLVFAGHKEPVNDAEFSLPHGRVVATAGSDGTVRLWDAQPQPSLARVGDEGARIETIAVRRDGRAFVAGTSTGRASIWQLGRRTPLSTIQLPGPVLGGVYASEPLMLAGGPRRSGLWNVATRRLVRTFGPDAGATAGALTPDARVFATARRDRISLWDRNGQPLRVLRSPAPVTGLALSADGRRLAAAGADGSAPTWDVATGEPISRCLAGRKPLTSVAFDPAGDRLLASSEDHLARVCDARTGRVLRELQWQFAVVSAAAFSADGRWIATAGPITAGLGMPASSAPLFLLPGHHVQLTAVAWSATGYRIVTGDKDGGLRTYDCRVCGRVSQLLPLAETRLGRLSSR